MPRRASEQSSYGQCKGSRWRRAQAACLAAGAARGTLCYGYGRVPHCPGIIDYTGSRWPPNHRLAATVHHIKELWQGGDPLDPANHAPAHRGCNTRLSLRARAEAIRNGHHFPRRRAKQRRVHALWELPVYSSRSW